MIAETSRSIQVLLGSIQVLLGMFLVAQAGCVASLEPSENEVDATDPSQDALVLIQADWRTGRSLITDEYWEFETPLTEREWQPGYIYRRVCGAEARELAVAAVARFDSLECDSWRQVDSEYFVCETGVSCASEDFRLFRRLPSGDHVLLADGYTSRFDDSRSHCAQQALINDFWDSLRTSSCESGPMIAPPPTQSELDTLLAACPEDDR